MKRFIVATLFGFFSLLFVSKPVIAGTDLVVNCPDNAVSCTTSPGNTPLFNESNILPGDSFSQTLTINNENTNDSCDLVLNAIDKTSGESVNIAQKIYAAIYSGATTYFGDHNGNTVIESQTYQELFDHGPISLGSLSPNSSLVLNWLAYFSATAGNDYQGVTTTFDFDVNITCGSPSTSGGTTPTPTSSPACTAQAPSAAPVLSITGSGPNSVSLAWTPVSPVSHYALVFTRNSDGESYGSTNIGNVTSYTVTHLSGGESYTFEVFAVNDCAPGDRSNQVTTGVVTGAVLSGRPQGPGGEVLGATVKETAASPVAKAVENKQGEVAGATTSVCQSWTFYLPLILLVIEALVTLLIEILQRKQPTMAKWLSSLLISLGLTILFYFLRNCDCSEINNVWVWLCKYYWLVAALVWGVIRTAGYAFIEETSN